MTPARRWCIVAAGVALVIGVPLGLQAVPADDRPLTAAQLLVRIQASSNHAYSGYVETLGTLQLPVADRFTDVGSLFGDRTRMRVWWRSDADWRVDKITTTGETDLYHENSETTTWDYERNEVTLSRDPEVRLPRTADLVPPELTARLLEDVRSDEVTRIGAARVAGVDAIGLRVSPAEPQSSIDHVDIWADPQTGVPLRVQVYADNATSAAFTSEFMSFSPDTPDRARTRFVPPPDSDISYNDVLDIADAANQFASSAPPARLAGLTRSTDTPLRAVGLYGAGVTRLMVVPLWDRAARPLREQLERTPGVRVVEEGDLLAVGPLTVLLTQAESCDAGWLIAGTVTERTVLTAAHDLATSARSLR